MEQKNRNLNCLTAMGNSSVHIHLVNSSSIFADVVDKRLRNERNYTIEQSQSVIEPYLKKIYIVTMIIN